MIKRYLTKDGRIIWIRLTAVSVHVDGKMVCFFSWIVPLPNGGSFKVSKNPEGKVEVRPTMSLPQFVGDNWKWFLGLGMLVTGLITKDQLLALLKLL
jgi:hypothetical protein